MPIYEFYCNKCDKKYELLLPMEFSDALFAPCEECGGLADRVMSTVSIRKSSSEEKPSKTAIIKNPNVLTKDNAYETLDAQNRQKKP